MAMGWMSALVEAVVPSLRLDLLMVGGVLLAPVFVRDGLSDVLRTVRFLPLDMTTPSGRDPRASRTKCSLQHRRTTDHQSSARVGPSG